MSSTVVIASDRLVEGFVDVPETHTSLWFRDRWEGNVVFNDGHVIWQTTSEVERTSYPPAGGGSPSWLSLRDDNLFDAVSEAAEVEPTIADGYQKSASQARMSILNWDVRKMAR